MSSRSRVPLLLVGGFVALVIAFFILRGLRPRGNQPVAAIDPLDNLPILRSNGDYLKAQSASQSMFKVAFKKFDQGLPLDDADRENLRRGARLCASMAAYLPGKAEGQDFTCGEALAALGYHAEAIHRYRMFLTYAGENPSDEKLKVVRADAYAFISVSLVAMGDFNGALDSANVALKAFPGTPAYLVDRASAEIRLGDKAAATQDLTEAATKSAADDPAKQKAQSLLKTLKPTK